MWGGGNPKYILIPRRGPRKTKKKNTRRDIRIYLTLAYVKMCAELLAAYITLNEGLPETDLLRGIADAPNSNVTENKTLRENVERLNRPPAKKNTEKDKFFNRLACLAARAKVLTDSNGVQSNGAH